MCKQVNSSWYIYIMTRIWKLPCNVKILRNTLERNIRTPKLSYLPVQYVDLPIVGYVSATSSSKIAVRSYANTELSKSSVCIIDVSRSSYWILPNLFTAVKHDALYEEFFVTLTEDFVVVRVVLELEEITREAKSYDVGSGEYKKRKRQLSVENLQMFSLCSQRKVADETFVGLESIDASKTIHNSNFLVIYTIFYIEIWKLDLEDDTIGRRQISLKGEDYIRSSFVYPHIMLENFVPDEARGHYTIQVWKLTESCTHVDHIVNVRDKDNFFHDNNRALRQPITSMKYVDSFFIVSTILQLPGQDGNNPCLGVRTFDNNGQVLQQVFLLDYNPHEFVEFLVYDDRLYAEVDVDLLIFSDKSHKYGVKNPNPIVYEKYDHLSFVSTPMIRLEEVGEARIQTFNGGYELLRLSTVNFWKRH